ncbi:hypothetical protein [Thermus tengchongensis]|nr:hypothetical protein [Thermus tengchongensis]
MNLQAEQEYEGYLPKALEEIRESLRTWLKEEGLARKSPTGGYYLVRR